MLPTQRICISRLFSSPEAGLFRAKVENARCHMLCHVMLCYAMLYESLGFTLLCNAILSRANERERPTNGKEQIIFSELFYYAILSILLLCNALLIVMLNADSQVLCPKQAITNPPSLRKKECESESAERRALPYRRE